MPKVHLVKLLPGSGEFDRPVVCGRTVDVTFVTDDPLRVTCAYCKETGEFLDRPLPYRVARS
jgi:hypothetical protein